MPLVPGAVGPGIMPAGFSGGLGQSGTRLLNCSEGVGANHFSMCSMGEGVVRLPGPMQV